jgi:probable F420-dependent oxidoreductase
MNPGYNGIMRIGVVFPQTELGGDAGAVRAYGQRVEELGFTHVLAYDHVAGADPDVYKGWNGAYDINTGAYDINTTFHEPLVMFGYLAAVTSTVELVTGVIILPQRQAVLVAKQATEVDLLSRGRLRLGIGVGWNPVEYEALGEEFTNRGKRSEEQVQLMRMLWTQRSVTFHGSYHRVTGAGLAPLPIQQPIPVWFGAQSPPAYRRAGRLGDGWFPQMQPGPELEEARRIVSGAATEAGRDPASLGMDGRASYTSDPEEMAKVLRSWSGAGATHVSINTMGAGLKSVDEHLDALASAAEVAKTLR